VVVGAPSAGRQSVETESLIGLFLNNLVLRTDLAGDPTFVELVARVKDVVLGAYRYQDVPFEKLVDALQPERDLSRAPLFQVLFNMVTLPPAELEMTGLTLERVETGDPGAKLDFTLYVTEAEDGLAIQTVYNADLFDRPRIEEVLRQLEHILTQTVARPEAPIGAVSLVTREAAARLPDPSAALPGDWRGAVHEGFSRRAALAWRWSGRGRPGPTASSRRGPTDWRGRLWPPGLRRATSSRFGPIALRRSPWRSWGRSRPGRR
jgi:non-ribosomal peptide synthetase component F